MKDLHKGFNRTILEIILIFIIAALAYLPKIAEASIYRDDWYYAMDRLIGGPGVFQEMFKIDRPARGPLFEAYYQAFKVEPLPYHITSFIWRLFGGFAGLYLFNLLFPGKKHFALYLAILFMLFPGYSRWLEGFENQPRILSSTLEVISIALTLQAIKSSTRISKVLSWAGAFLTGWAYISFVDFSFGMEVFRFLCVYIFANRENPQYSIFNKSLKALHSWLPAAIIPAGFLFWRLFIFHNERPTTDIALQLSYLFASPLRTGMLWLIRLFQSSVNIAFLAWSMPTAQTLFNYSVSQILYGIFLAALAVVAIIIVETFFPAEKEEKTNCLQSQSKNWQFEVMLISLMGIIAGVMPVIAANRFATLGNYSHYALPASLAGAVFIGTLIFSIHSPRIRLAAISSIVFLAVLTHYTISLRIVSEETIISNFWHQMVWRAPGIQPGTTLVVNYPSVDYGQDVDTVAGPANYLYFPQSTNQIPATYPLSALEQGEQSSKDILTNREKSYMFQYRTHMSEVNYTKLLIISQPSENSCVHIMDAKWPRLSADDPYRMSVIAPLSKIERVVTDATAPIPDVSIFGHEPKHTWCYYYQKAELALQKRDWDQILKLGDEVIKQDFHPNDPGEWMPFLQAYAYSGNTKILPTIAKSFKQDLFYRKQACQILQEMNRVQYRMTPEVVGEVNRLFCED